MAAVVGLIGLSPGVAQAQGLPTVRCTYDVVTLGVEQYCINVYGEGLYDDKVSGELEKVSSDPSPIEGAEVNLFGTLENGAPYNMTAVAPDGISSATAWFYPRTNFQDGSQLCIRAKIGAVE
ncbi:hypothetical protein [Pseudonocardia sp. H11422]|uniref:hypothetical protein n=1 Tax=Pseudonocardia sp. H11422 TaxID=2835866 RepID=UPI001BDCFA4A|nr:hypothetical protein [Pseudonocardia sp. H11422]